MSNIAASLTLFCHPAVSTRISHRMDASIAYSASTHIAFHYRVFGEIERLQIPLPQAPAHTDGLWAHTCCEAFVGEPGKAAYREFNFSPSGQWAVYDFSGYRQRVTEDPVADPPSIVTRSGQGCFELTAFVPLSLLPAAGPLEVGLSAVLEAAGEEAEANRLSYWALHHPSSRPDFHHRGGFAFRLEPNPAKGGE